MAQNNSIKVNVRDSADLFQMPIRYVIPPYQRRYVWDEDEQWDPLWEDVSGLAEQNFDPSEAQSAMSDGRSHFLGAVVLQQELNATGDIGIRRVIDGQQRLTTLQLLLDAAQEEYELAGIRVANRLRSLVANEQDFVEAPDEEFKVWPTQGDQAAFRHAMHNDLATGDYADSQVVRAHEFFRSKIHGWIRANGEVDAGRAQSLYEVLRNRLQMVVIDLGHDADPQLIFETLNARGTPLLQSDLVRNYIIYAADRAGVDHNELAVNWFNEKWWTEEVRQGRLRRQRIEQFLNYWLVMRTSEEVQAGDVFQRFRDFADRAVAEGGTIEAIVEDINAVSEYFVRLENPTNDSQAGLAMGRFKTLDIGVVTPILLFLLSKESETPKGVIDRSVRALESYLVRRALCGHTSMGLNRVMLELLNRVAREGADVADRTIVDFLEAQTVERRAWPTDKKFSDALLNRPLYGSFARSKLVMVLTAIQDHLHSNKSEQVNYDTLTIEHILPQKWQSSQWTAPAAEINESGEDGLEQRARMMQTIGNLTLTTQPLNSSLSNDRWELKRAALGKWTGLALNRELLDHVPVEWNEKAIYERSVRLSEYAMNIWPGPQDI